MLVSTAEADCGNVATADADAGTTLPFRIQTVQSFETWPLNPSSHPVAVETRSN